MLSSIEIGRTLVTAIREYDFPRVTFDFQQSREIRHQSMTDVEAEIRRQLLAENLDAIKDGFSNVLYWGYARTGYRSARVSRFRNTVTAEKLERAKQTLRNVSGPGVKAIADIGLPQFSGMSFVSKVRMFLDPTNYVVLDRQLLKLREQNQRNLFHEVQFGSAETRIRISAHNVVIYERWAKICQRLAALHFSEQGIRAVDIERGIFYLVQTGRGEVAVDMITKF